MRFLLLLILLPTVAYGQDPRPEVVSTVPADVFNYFAWAAGIIIAAQAAGVVALFKRSGKAGLSQEEHEWLKWLKDTHDQRDTDGILTWMVPRPWGEILKNVQEAVKQQMEVDEVRERLEQEQTERREQVEALLREQKDIMQIAMETNIKIGTALDNNHNVLGRVEQLLASKDA
jgi:flagellar motility protein MotE (MotC chaperone)